MNSYSFQQHKLREKYPNTEFFLVLIWTLVNSKVTIIAYLPIQETFPVPKLKSKTIVGQKNRKKQFFS